MSNIIVYPRLHMFSLDLSISDGHMKSGSLCCSIPNLPIRIDAALCNDKDKILTKFSGDHSLPMMLDRLRDYLGVRYYWEVNVTLPDTLKPHIGLGSSTQITGGILIACAKLMGRDIKLIELFHLGLGHRSTAGLNLIYNPGLLLEYGYELASVEDGGRHIREEYSVTERPVEKVIRLNNFPWWVIAAIPTSLRSISGEIESKFYTGLLPESSNIARQTSIAAERYIVPAIINRNFGHFIHGMQRATDTPVKKAEVNIQTDSTKNLLKSMSRIFGFSSISSLGPTIYSFSDSDPSSVLAELPKSYIYYSFKANQ